MRGWSNPRRTNQNSPTGAPDIMMVASQTTGRNAAVGFADSMRQPVESPRRAGGRESRRGATGARLSADQQCQMLAEAAQRAAHRSGLRGDYPGSHLNGRVREMEDAWPIDRQSQLSALVASGLASELPRRGTESFPDVDINSVISPSNAQFQENTSTPHRAQRGATRRRTARSGWSAAPQGVGAQRAFAPSSSSPLIGTSCVPPWWCGGASPAHHITYADVVMQPAELEAWEASRRVEQPIPFKIVDVCLSDHPLPGVNDSLQWAQNVVWRLMHLGYQQELVVAMFDCLPNDFEQVSRWLAGPPPRPRVHTHTHTHTHHTHTHTHTVGAQRGLRVHASDYRRSAQPQIQGKHS